MNIAIRSLPARDMAARLLRQVEGLRLTPYQDSVGVWTVGCGTTVIGGEPVTARTPPLTPAQADALMLSEMDEKADAVDMAAPFGATDAQLAACYSFAFNEGTHAFETSTLLRLWRAGDVLGAADQFNAWVYAGGRVIKGLVNRRHLERAVFLGLTTV